MEKLPKFKRPNPQGTRSKSKIVRVHGRLYRIVATIENAGRPSTVKLVTTKGEILELIASNVTPALPGDESNFNAQYQRHLRKLDADKIKHPKK